MTNFKKISIVGAIAMAMAGTAAIAQNTAPATDSNSANTTTQTEQQTDRSKRRAMKASFRKGRGKHHRRSGRGGRGMMKEILRQADADKDDALTQAELNTFVNQTVTGADTNTDNDITIQEFEKIWLDLNRRRMADMFQRLDSDASGTITEAERAEVFGNVIAKMDRNADGKLDAADRGGRRDGHRKNRGGEKHDRDHRRNK